MADRSGDRAGEVSCAAVLLSSGRARGAARLHQHLNAEWAVHDRLILPAKNKDLGFDAGQYVAAPIRGPEGRHCAVLCVFAPLGRQLAHDGAQTQTQAPAGQEFVVQALAALAAEIIAPATPAQSERAALKNGLLNDVPALPDPLPEGPASGLSPQRVDLVSFVSSAPNAIAMLDKFGRQLACSNKWRADGWDADLQDIITRSSGNADDIASAFGQTLRGVAMDGQITDFQRADGQYRSVSWSTHPWMRADGRIAGVMVHAEDVTAARHYERELRRSKAEARRIAYTDTLTGFPNRLSLTRSLSQPLGKLCEGDEALVVLSIDLVRFRSINNLHGSQTADALLVHVADGIAQTAGPRAIVGRMASDEFCVVVPTPRTECFQVADRIGQLMNGQHVISGRRVNVRLSIGAAAYPADGDTGVQLLRRAEIARMEAKRAPHLTFQSITDSIEGAADQRMRIEKDLRRAITQEELFLAYQPIIDVASGRAVGVEALARWNHPEQGFVPPDLFIRSAEQTGDIGDLGDWVFRTAMADLRDQPGLLLSVNVSPVQFNDPAFLDRLKDALVESDFNPHQLELEVTENLLINNPDEVRTRLKAIQAMGIRIALDDFGTGYSSLAYLQDYKFDKLKIDRSFINRLGEDRDGLALVQCMITMGKALRMQITAEGIEEQDQATMLRHAGCDLMQGYFYARPGKLDDAISLAEPSRVSATTGR